MALNTLALKPRDIVSYEDMANPRKFYEVIEVFTDRWGTHFRLNPQGERWDSCAELKVSDCRQHGWDLHNG